jgi:hypothetical protein
MSGMVERVAKAIAEVLTRDRPHPVSGRGYCLLIVEDEDAKEMARAAIKAMREPTEAMVHAALVTPDEWAMAIDEALK